MERKRALAVSGVATLMVLVMVGMAVALVQMSSEGPDGVDDTGDLAAGLSAPTTTASPASVTPEPVIEYQDVYELVPGSPATADRAGSTGGAAPATPDADGSSSPAPASAPSATSSAPTAPPSQPRATTTAPASPATTTTTRPPGVPADWPADRPIPPIPPGCQKPQLEDDGVWNCDH